MLESGVCVKLKKAAPPVEIGLSRTETNKENATMSRDKGVRIKGAG